MESPILIDTPKEKSLVSPNYNYKFNKETGLHLRWGKDLDTDASWSPYGPEILDLEISMGKCSGNCPFCYKENGSKAKTEHHMTIDEFKIILEKIPNVLTQIAFGICDINSNDDFWEMMKHSRERGIIPNYTCNGYQVTDDVAKKTAELCGAVAVSIVDEPRSLEAIKTFVGAGNTQVNIHYMLSEETYSGAFKLIDKVKNIDGFRAIVFLQYKPKGRNPDAFTVLQSVDRYKKLIEHCKTNGVMHGFDSCSCPSWFQTLADQENFDEIAMQGEPCESGLFSSYINCFGKFFPCSFTEGEEGWKTGLDVLNCNTFIDDIWMNPRVIEWRNNLINSSQQCNCKMKHLCRSCPVFNVSPCKNE